MKTVVAIAACLLGSCPLYAQMAPPAGSVPEFLQNRNNQAILESNATSFERHDTDKQREDRLQKAIALRAVAEQLTIADGGVMTRSHLRYIRTKANKILTD